VRASGVFRDEAMRIVSRPPCSLCTMQRRAGTPRSMPVHQMDPRISAQALRAAQHTGHEVIIWTRKGGGGYCNVMPGPARVRAGVSLRQRSWPPRFRPRWPRDLRAHASAH